METGCEVEMVKRLKELQIVFSIIATLSSICSVCASFVERENSYTYALIALIFYFFSIVARKISEFIDKK